MLSCRLALHLTLVEDLFESRRLGLEEVLSWAFYFTFFISFTHCCLQRQKVALLHCMTSIRLFKFFKDWSLHILEKLSLSFNLITVLQL